jgi:DNA-binding CsgD family transcriptional regulator
MELKPTNKIELVHLENAAKIFSQSANFQRIAFFLYRPENHRIQGLLGHNLNTNVIHTISEPWEKLPVCPMTLSSEIPVYLPAASKHGLPQRYVRMFGLTSLMIIPLIVESEIIGSAIADRSGKYFEPSKELVENCIRFGYHTGILLHSLYEKNHPLLSFNSLSLSPREKDVLQHASYGESAKEIAAILELSEYTVRDYLKTATEKLNAKNRTEAVAKALRLGIIL